MGFPNDPVEPGDLGRARVVVGVLAVARLRSCDWGLDDDVQTVWSSDTAYHWETISGENDSAVSGGRRPSY